MKILVTHKFPHLDDIAAIWLWKRYVKAFREALVKFVELKGTGQALTYKNQPVDSDPDVIHFGLGRGRFDEHKGDIGKCATKLVYEELLRKKLIPKNEALAISKIVDYVNKIDTGLMMAPETFWLPDVLREIEPSLKRYRIGAELLDASVPLFLNEAILGHDWKAAKLFTSKWGMAVAVKTSAEGAESMGYRLGYVLVIHLDPKRGWRMLRANATSKVDLTSVRDELARVEPKAPWFLHHTKRCCFAVRVRHLTW